MEFSKMSTLNQTKINACMNKYKNYMREIKKRSEVIDNVTKIHNLSTSAGKDAAITGFIEADIDLAYLQLRKIIELIMYSCVVANELAGIELTKELKKGYRPKTLRKILQKHNNDFFPVPVQTTKDNETGIMSTEAVQDGFCSFTDLEVIHGKCGDILHAKRDYTYSDKHKLFENCNNTLNEIKTLLNNHWINIDSDHSFAVVMRSSEDGKINIALMGVICATDDPNYKTKILEAQKKCNEKNT